MIWIYVIGWIICARICYFIMEIISCVIPHSEYETRPPAEVAFYAMLILLIFWWVYVFMLLVFFLAKPIWTVREFKKAWKVYRGKIA